MAGKKGMKQARPRTQEERDKYALARIEELLDKAIEGGDIKKWSPLRMRAIEIRYNKLRATLASTELTDKREGWVDVMKRLADKKSVAHAPQTQQIQAKEEGKPNVTH